MPVTLKNTSKRIRQFHLPKSCDGAGMSGTTIHQHRLVQDKHGTARYRPKKMRMPPVLTLLPGEVLDGLPEQVLAAPDLKRAINDPKDGIRLMKMSVPKRSSTPPPTAKSDEPKPSSTSKRRYKSEAKTGE